MLDRTQSQLATASDVSLSHISKALRDLKGQGLAECINPDEKVGKIYRRTKEGEEIAEQMLKALE